MNIALGNATDAPERVAEAVENMLLARRMRDRAIGWPERFFLRLNAIFPGLVDGALRKQLSTIKSFAQTDSSAKRPGQVDRPANPVTETGPQAHAHPQP